MDASEAQALMRTQPPHRSLRLQRQWSERLARCGIVRAADLSHGADLEKMTVGIAEEASYLPTPVVRWSQEFGSPRLEDIVGRLAVWNPDRERMVD